MTLPGHFQIRWLNNTIDVLLGPEVPAITQGYAKYEEVDRPKRSAVVEYVGISVFKLSISCLFDGWIPSRSVEPDITKLEKLALPPPGNPGTKPTSFKVVGPVPHSEKNWFIESIDWGEAIYEGNVRLRQAFTLNLIERVDMPAVLGNELRPDLRKWKIVVSKTGDLRELAMLMLGDSTLWRRMTNVQGRPFRDWRQKRGIKVRVPQ